MKGYITIIRPLNCLLAGFAVIIGLQMGGAPMGSLTALFAFLAAFLICGAGNTINDYYDFEIDKVNRPLRPLPSGQMTTGAAHKYSLFLFGSGVFASVFINFPALLLAVFNSVLLYLYASGIKPSGGLTKNLSVSYLVASPFLFGGLAAENPSPTLFFVFIAIFVNTSREVVKDIEDYEGDVKHLVSLPVRFGFRISGLITSTMLVSSIFLSVLPYRMGMVGEVYVPFIVLADAILFYSALSIFLLPKERASMVQRLIKIAMVFALLGFFLGSL